MTGAGSKGPRLALIFIFVPSLLLSASIISAGEPSKPPSPNSKPYKHAKAGTPFVTSYDEPQRPEDLLAYGYYGFPPALEANNIDALPSALQQGAFDPEVLLPQDFAEAQVDELPGSQNEAGFFELPTWVGQTSGLAVDVQQHLVLFHRGDRVWNELTFDSQNRLNRTYAKQPISNATIAVLDPVNGRVVAEHAKNLVYMPHGLSIDPEGNMWLTDVGSHQVIKLDAKKQFQPTLVLGEKMVPGSDEKHFCKPTDVAVAKNGDFFVADGYCNSRIMRFDKQGNFITSFGQPNSGPLPAIGEFFVPHSLTLIEDLNLLCVADRENERIQCFAAGLVDDGLRHHPRAYIPTGTFFTKAEHIGRVYAVREKQHYLVGVTDRDEQRQVEPQVFVMDMNTGRANTFARGLENAHALTLSDNGDIYVAQINPNQIVKFSVPRESVSDDEPTLIETAESE
jgi:DNA-binding beta-propeller fold protein YncE